MTPDVEVALISGVWWRHIPHGGDIWYRPPDPADGRWQRGAVVEAIYLADSPETAWAEWYRMLAEFALRPAVSMPRDMWRMRVDGLRAADLSDAERLDRVGLPFPVPGRASWSAFQQIGERLFADGWSALIGPSAARPASGRVLCVFRTTQQPACIAVAPPPQVFLEPPPPPKGMRT